MTFALSHSTEITSAAAILTLPFYIYMMRKDERYRKLFTVPEPDPWKVPVWKYLFPAILGITAGIALNNILILSNISSISAAYQTTAEGLYAAPLPVEVIGLGVLIPILKSVCTGRDLQETAGSDGCEESNLVFSIDFCCRTWKHCTVFVCVRLRTDFVLCL